VLCKKTTEPIEMPFGTVSRMDPENHVLDASGDAPTRRGTFRGMSGPLQSVGFWGLVKRLSCVKAGGPMHKEVYL